MKEALFYEKLGEDRVQCHLCPHECKISPDRVGICGVRENRAGTLYTLVYGRAIAVHVDPIEKKPLFHLYPGTKSFSIATVGCNFHCDFCQNSDISQVSKKEGRLLEEISGQPIEPQELVSLALKYDCKTIAYTYTEPTIFFEYAYETAKLAHEKGILNLFITNGYINEEPLRYINPYLDAANVDLKGFNKEFYRHVVGGKLEAVLDSLKLMKKLGIWVEVTTLLVPTHTDSEDGLKKVAQFIREELGPETPWHISRFYPHYKMLDLPPTPLRSIRRAREIGLEAGLRYVYSGNVPGDEGEHTYCYNCGKLLIRRFGFQILENKIEDSKCPYCGANIDGIGM